MCAVSAIGVYSLGVVAYELLTGRLPFTGETPMAIAYQHLHDPLPAPSARNPAVPPGLDGWVSSMTEKSREARFYALTAKGRKQLAQEEESWAKLTDGVGRVLRYA